MTLRQVLDVLWKRAWIILVVTAVATATAAVYVAVREVSYQTEGTVRLNVIVTDAVETGEIGGVVVDLDPETITAPLILDPAAELTGEAPAALTGQIEAEFEEGARTGRIVISGTGPTPESAQTRTEAVIETYRAYLDQQMEMVTQTLRDRHTAAVEEATELQAEIARNPNNSIATTNLGIALGEMTALQSTLNEITTAGPTGTVLNAVQPGAPVQPGRFIVLALALATGLIVGIGAALIRDQFDNRLRSSDEIEEISSASSLGELRWDRGVKRMDPPLPVASRSRTGLSEGLRAVRSTLQVLLPAHRAVIVLTSVAPGDGKSFISSNLALAWARAGRQVVLVGGDLRRPELGRYFDDAADGPGLAELLLERGTHGSITEAGVAGMLNETAYPRLRVLPAGAEPADPADLLAGDGWAEVVAALRSLADIVIVDSPPAMGIVDASLLAAHADGAALIASVGRSDRAMIVDSIDSLEANGVQVLGVIANRGRRRLPKAYATYLGSTSEPAQGAPESRRALRDVPDQSVDEGPGRPGEVSSPDTAATPADSPSEPLPRARVSARPPGKSRKADTR